MNQVSDNPYSAPEADLELEHEVGDLSVFKRFSTWGVFFLSIITVGIYSAYWLYDRTKKLNSICSDPIPSGFYNTALILYIVNFFTSFGSGFAGEAAPILTAVDGVLSLVVTIMFIVWVFKLRNRLNQVTNSAGKPTWCGPILTFFFNVLYLNYKINQNIDARG